MGKYNFENDGNEFDKTIRIGDLNKEIIKHESEEKNDFEEDDDIKIYKKSTDKKQGYDGKNCSAPVPWRRPPNKTGYAESRRAEKYQNIGHSSFSKIAESRACQKGQQKEFFQTTSPFLN